MIDKRCKLTDNRIRYELTGRNNKSNGRTGNNDFHAD